MTQAPELPLHMRRNGFNPTPELREIRETTGVRTIISAYGMEVYLVTRHDDVKAVLSDHQRFSNGRPPGFVVPGAPGASEEEQASARAGNLLGLDPPEHQRLRRMLTAEFTIRRMKRLEPRIAEIVDQQLDAMETAGPPVDLVENFALPIPSLVICELLGVPYDDRDDFQRRSARQLDLSIPIPERLELQRQGRTYMSSLVERSRRHPGEDILGMLVREHGAELTDDELIGIASLLLLAGHETTSNMLGLGTLALLRHPDQLDRGPRRPRRRRPRHRGAAALALHRAQRNSAHHHHRRRGRRGTDSGRQTRVRVAAVGQSGSRLRRLTGSPRHPPWRPRAPGLRPRRASLPGRPAGADGDAYCIPRAVPPLPDVGTRREFRRCAVPVVPLHLRAEVAKREMVKVIADRDTCISAGNCVMVASAVFDQDDYGIVVVLVDEVPEGEEEHAREAVKLCPSQALRLASEE